MNKKNAAQSGGKDDVQAKSTTPQRKPETKRERILNLLRSGQSLNIFDAERHGEHSLGCTIHGLRQSGHPIVGTWEDVPTRFWGTVRVKRYSYAGGRKAE
ncbi:helix-turn-helix domain-containing protein [Cupriavidus taiwanensis]|uniref:Winged helix-turn-helix domain-containing protein n=1 Tax=Cupriavidus taiwanensis TaxID=164546 RepID=A0A375J295_9BURK|nr:helix-turn-helix domain-containing protein [Cupriavidus taiwanensis]SPR99315.1 hypothetical protein CBM2634_A80247 [Cupriavidus taiwanensis]